MSLTKRDRKNQSTFGNIFTEGQSLSSVAFSQAISIALHREYGQTNAAIKSVVAITHANQRAVRNWFDAKNAPRGHHLIQLLRHSDGVLEMVLEASGRRDILIGLKLVAARDALVKVVGLIEQLSDASSK